MPQDAGTSVLLRMIEMYATGDVSLAQETVGAEYRDHALPERVSVPAAGVELFREIVEATRRPFVALDVWPEGVFTELGQVTAQVHWHGTLPDGKTLDRVTIEVVRVDDGRAVEHWAKPIESTADSRPDVSG